MNCCIETLNTHITTHLSKLPRKILKAKQCNYLIDCLLYELSKQECLNLSSIAFCVYNPDFKICKGYSGILSSEISYSNEDIWHESFFQELNKTSFNQLIKSIHFSTKKDTNPAEIKHHLKEQFLNEKIEESYMFELPNDNIGIVSYASKNSEPESFLSFLEDASALLGFCPLS